MPQEVIDRIHILARRASSARGGGEFVNRLGFPDVAANEDVPDDSSGSDVMTPPFTLIPTMLLWTMMYMLMNLIKLLLPLLILTILIILILLMLPLLRSQE
jgi:hypothetical protein